MDDGIKDTLAEILTIVRRLDARISGADGGLTFDDAPPANTLPAKPLSLKEFIIDRDPANGVQMTLTVGYYLETREGITPFNTADLEVAFRAAREPVPSNLNDKANMCVRNGHFMEDKDKKNNLKAWVVTRTGEDIVRQGFNKKRGSSRTEHG